MSDIKFECPKCGQHIVTEEYFGMEIQCPTCSCNLIIPDVSHDTNNDSKEMVMYIRTDSWENILAQLKLVQNRNIKKLTLFNEVNESLSLIRTEHYTAIFDNKDDTFVTLSTTITFKKVIEIFEDFYKIQTINRQKIRWANVKELDKNKKRTTCTTVSSKIISENQTRKKTTDFNWKQFFSMDSKNLGWGGIIILIFPLFLLLVFGSLGPCASSSHNPSREIKIKQNIEINTKQLVNNLASRHNINISSLEIHPYVHLNRQEAEADVYVYLRNSYNQEEKWKYHFVFTLGKDDELYFKKDGFSSEKFD